jgi:hypothetical protein
MQAVRRAGRGIRDAALPMTEKTMNNLSNGQARTPEEARRAAIGEFELCTSFRFGGTPYELAERSLRLYAREVLPVLKSWGSASAQAAAAK